MENLNHSFQDYSVIEGLSKEIHIPPMLKIRQHFDDTHLTDVAGEVCRQLRNKGLEELLRPRMCICLTGSSRGIASMNVVLQEAVSYLKHLGCHLFTVSAMGGYGGATAEGQRLTLFGYGITEEFYGYPIDSSMEAVELGYVEGEGKRLPIYIDKLTYEADGIMAINRIKPHSAFQGGCEPGLTKMFCISLGNQEGADSSRRDGFGMFKTHIPLFGSFVRTHAKVLFDIGVIENAHDQTRGVTVLRSGEIPAEELGLLECAKGLVPRVLVDETDVIVMKETGKDFSDNGIDPSITGAWSTPYGGSDLKHQHMAVLGLIKAPHGNRMGIGQADTTTLRFYGRFNYLETYPNALTSTIFWPVKLAMILRDNKMAIQGMIRTCSHTDPEDLRIVLIRNTLTMGKLHLSKAYWELAQNTPGIEIVKEPKELPFDERGNLLIWEERQ